jgi:uncharacterized protein YdaU (DUF1376 family)
MNFPRMSLHVGDYIRDTRHLRAAGHGAYLLLIMHYWATGSLPNDDEQLATIACMTDREWQKHKPSIQALFRPGWKHKRIEAELADAKESRTRRSKAGKDGNEKRWGRHRNVDRIAIPEQSHCDPKATSLGSLPPTSHHGKEPEQEGAYPRGRETVVEGGEVIRLARGLE